MRQGFGSYRIETLIGFTQNSQKSQNYENDEPLKWGDSLYFIPDFVKKFDISIPIQYQNDCFSLHNVTFLVFLHLILICKSKLLIIHKNSKQ